MNQAASLHDKIALTRERMTRVLEKHGPDASAVAWTGGKDSTTVLYLWRELLAERAPEAKVKALSIDTGVKFPEIVAFRERIAAEWSIDLQVVRPGIGIEDYPVAENKVSCCIDLKIEPLKHAIRQNGFAAILSGVRADEHPDRAGRAWLEERDDPPHVLANPILHWSEMDIWAFAMDAGLPYCELYDRGYRSLGCMPCTTRPDDAAEPERAGRNAEKEKQLGMLHGLGYF
jgi:phosphoadenosine phosphosulfate reductase